MQIGSRVGVAWVLTLAVLALAGFGKTSAQVYCTPETCPPGIVIAYFQYSNCTGDVMYAPFDPPFPTNECLNSSTSSVIIEVTEDYWEYREHSGSSDCGQSDGPQAYMGFRYYFGSCEVNEPSKRRDQKSAGSGLRSKLSFPGFARSSTVEEFEYRSSAFLLNVNVTMERQDPVEVSPEVPILSVVQVAEPCYSPDNCTFNGENPLFYTTSSTNDTCVESVSSFMVANITAGECYIDEGFYHYVRIRCIDTHTIFSDIVAGDRQRIVSSDFTHQECGPYAGNEVTYCLAVPSPMTPSPPVPVPISSSPSNSSSLFIMIAFIFATIAFI